MPERHTGGGGELGHQDESGGDRKGDVPALARVFDALGVVSRGGIDVDDERQV